MNKYSVYYEADGRLGIDIVDGKSRVDAELKLSAALEQEVQFLRAERIFEEVDGQFTKRSCIPKTKEMETLDSLEKEIQVVYEEIRLYEALVNHHGENDTGEDVTPFIRKIVSLESAVYLLKYECDISETKIFGK